MHSTPDSPPKADQPPDSLRPTALMISRDLFFSSKVTGTAAELGFRVVVEGNLAQAASKAADSTYRCIILDLSTPGLTVPDVIAALPAANRPTVIAFGPHVETARLNERARPAATKSCPAASSRPPCPKF